MGKKCFFLLFVSIVNENGSEFSFTLGCFFVFCTIQTFSGKTTIELLF